MSSFLFTSFGEVTKLLPAPYVFMISPRVVGKNDLQCMKGCTTAHTSTYIKKSFQGNLMYELAGVYINKYFNYAGPSMS